MEYELLSVAQYEQHYREQQLKHLQKKAAKLGFQFTPTWLFLRLLYWAACWSQGHSLKLWKAATHIYRIGNTPESQADDKQDNPSWMILVRQSDTQEFVHWQEQRKSLPHRYLGAVLAVP